MSHLAQSQAVKSRIIRTAPIAWKKVHFLQHEDFKQWIPAGDKKLCESLLKYQFVDPFKVWADGDVIYCLDGKHRHDDLLEIEKNGVTVPEFLDATFIDCRDRKEAAELVLVYSSQYARITQQGLFDFIQTHDISYDEMKLAVELPEFDDMAFHALFKNPDDGADSPQVIARSLQERFLIPPFSILDTRQGYWQERKKHWQQFGFNSQETREDIELMADSAQPPAVYELRNKMRDTLGYDPSWQEITEYAKKKGLHLYHGSSIFDPVLAEVLYTWFCIPGGSILDPFAGGSVRGIVAGILGYEYCGIDLRQDQVDANIRQGNEMQMQNITWLQGDSTGLSSMIDPTIFFDFAFSCPPYHDLEQYSDDPADLSNMTYEEFITAYRSIVQQTVARLKDNRFAAFVVSDIRDKEGYYRNFVSDTIAAFRDAGMQLYNEIILINIAGSLAVRVGRQFAGYRKVGKTHQNVLVFYKGNIKAIKTNYPEIQLSELSEPTAHDRE